MPHKRHDIKSTKDNDNSEEDDFIPYTYIIEYTHSFNDETLPSASHDSHVVVDPHTSPKATHVQKKEPRLISEDIYKKVAIYTEEGYDRGAYDHQGYEKVNKNWNDHLEYDHRTYGGVKGSVDDDDKNDNDKEHHDADTGETKENLKVKHFSPTTADGVQHHLQVNRHHRQQSRAPNHSQGLLENLHWYTKTPQRDKTHLVPVSRHLHLPRDLQPPPAPRHHLHRESAVGRILHTSHTNPETSTENKFILKTDSWDDNKVKSKTVSGVEDYPDGGQQIMSSNWSPFRFVLPDEMRQMATFPSSETASASENLLRMSTSPSSQESQRPRGKSHRNYILEVQTNSDPHSSDKPSYTIETRTGHGTNIKNGLAPHDRPSAEVGVINTAGHKGDLYSRPPCLSQHLVTAHYNLDGWRPRRGRPAWMRDETPFLGTLKGQVDVLRETVFAPVLRHALCE
ncbi:hypothetical protein Hamer_G016657 [Homarus americanus]|uniref:Uncharacterized protein n=1 Tax=Homarus americanus TaxID=6706 RepID=A0A8J5JKS1_HOMAM|nr:hypothetical protein Hamer_G016657 [Homarus americanus]